MLAGVMVKGQSMFCVLCWKKEREPFEIDDSDGERAGSLMMRALPTHSTRPSDWYLIGVRGFKFKFCSLLASGPPSSNSLSFGCSCPHHDHDDHDHDIRWWIYLYLVGH
jgi:hypothetical protein